MIATEKNRTQETPPYSKQATQLRMLNALSAKLQGLLNSSAFHQEIVNIVQSSFNYYSVTIWSLENGHLILRGQAGAYSPHLKEGDEFPAGHEADLAPGILAHVVRTKKSYVANDLAQDPKFTNLSFPVYSKSELCVPVLKDGELLAVINVESDVINAFDQDDVVTLEAVASQVGVAITNRNLFTNVTEFNSRLQQAVSEKTRELQSAHERILEQQKLLQRENKALRNLVNMDKKESDIIGKSPAILSVLSMVDKIAPTPATVLLQGESGTGKELIARRLHYRSDRTEKPYVTLNCGALQESLLESELFGHEKGAFTGAVNQKIGLAEVASGGTLFLDEIGELSLNIQAKLLRFLQEGEFYRVGGKRPIKVDVRVISATNRDLEQEVKDGRFREDLFYRINTITLRMPPLRKRAEDIGTLVEFFLKQDRMGGAARSIKKVDPRVIDVFMKYPWPGNIRELQNTVERLRILSENNEIRLEDVPFNIRMPRETKSGAANSEYSVNMTLEEMEKAHILRALSYHHGNKTKTAHSLGITIKTLYNKLHRYGVEIGGDRMMS